MASLLLTFAEPLFYKLVDAVMEQERTAVEQLEILFHFKDDYNWLCNHIDELNDLLDGEMSSPMRFGRAGSHKWRCDRMPKDVERKIYKIMRDADSLKEDCDFQNGLFNWYFRLEAGKRIREIRKESEGMRLQVARGRRSNQTPTAAENSQLLLRRASLMRTDSIKPRLQAVEPPHVGAETAFSRLEGLLVDDKTVGFIGVLGMGGSGKSALVKNVWNSERVQKSFEEDLLIWVTVSRSEPAWLRKTIADQIPGVTGFNGSWAEEDAAKGIIFRSLQQRRYLLVLDDVCYVGSDGLLSSLGLPLPVGETSKIVVTSRDKRVLLRISRQINIVRLEALSDDKSWDLFRHHAFGDEISSLSPEVLRIARGFANACKGHPLALKACGAAMAGELHPEEWRLASRRSNNTSFDRTTFFCPDADAESEIFRCLRSSYEPLPRALQLCFLCFAAFPENHIILTTDLIHLWSAEGLLGRSVQSPFQSDELGRSYLKKLIDRCLVEKVEEGSLNIIRKCKMHGMLRHLAMHVLRNEEREEKCLFRAGENLDSWPDKINDCTRISLMYNSIASLPRDFDCPRLRILLLRHNALLRVIPPNFFTHLTCLKTLDLSMTAIETLPESLGCLQRLLHLNLSRTKLKHLPASLTLLERLQSLNLFECKELLSLPVDIADLTFLRCLHLRRCAKLKFLPSGISKLSRLRTLTMDACNSLQWITQQTQTMQYPSIACLNDLTTLTRLERLALVCNSGASEIPDGLLEGFKEMERLDLSMLRAEALPRDILNMKILQDLRLSRWERLLDLPGWICNDLKSLTRITLEYLHVEQLPSGLETLPELRLLEIEHCHCLTQLPSAFGRRDAFPALEELRLEDLKAVESLPVLEEGSMRMVKEFRVRYCAGMKNFPKGFEKFSSSLNLRVIDITGSSALRESVQKNGFDRERLKDCLGFFVM